MDIKMECPRCHVYELEFELLSEDRGRYRCNACGYTEFARLIPAKEAFPEHYNTPPAELQAPPVAKASGKQRRARG